VVALECADINGDGLPDYLLVTQDQALTKRTLQILLRRPTGEIFSALTNSQIAQPPFEDGVMGGGVQILARRNKFQVEDISGGSGGGERFVYYFEYSKSEKTWLLTRGEKRGWGTGAEGYRDKTWLPGTFGRIAIDEFNHQIR
jgi:hypothetical protein